MVKLIENLQKKVLIKIYRNKAKHIVKLIKEDKMQEVEKMLSLEPILPYVNELLPEEEKLYDINLLYVMDLYQVKKCGDNQVEGSYKKSIIVKMDGPKTRVFRRITRYPYRYYSSVNQYKKESEGIDNFVGEVCSNVKGHKRLSDRFIQRFVKLKDLIEFENKTNEYQKNLPNQPKTENMFIVK